MDRTAGSTADSSEELLSDASLSSSRGAAHDASTSQLVPVLDASETTTLELDHEDDGAPATHSGVALIVDTSSGSSSPTLTKSDDKPILPSVFEDELSIRKYRMSQEPFKTEATGDSYFGRHRDNAFDCIAIKCLERGTPEDYMGDPRNSCAYCEMHILVNVLPFHENVIECLGITSIRFWSLEAQEERSIFPSLIFRFYSHLTLADYIDLHILRDVASESDEETPTGTFATSWTGDPFFCPHLDGAAASDVPIWLQLSAVQPYPVFPKLKPGLHVRNVLYMHDLLSALAHLSRHHVVHRNVNPSSVTILHSRRPRAILGNFAFAVRPGTHAAESDEPALGVGMAAYRAPELLKHDAMAWLERKLRSDAAALHKIPGHGASSQADSSKSRLSESAARHLAGRMELHEADRQRLAELKATVHRECSYPVDVWSAAMVMIELYMGCSPFSYCKDHVEAMYSFIEENLFAPTKGAKSPTLSLYLLSVKATMDDDDAFDMLLAMLQENPKDRPTPEALLSFKYFKVLSSHPDLY